MAMKVNNPKQTVTFSAKQTFTEFKFKSIEEKREEKFLLTLILRLKQSTEFNYMHVHMYAICGYIIHYYTSVRRISGNFFINKIR